MNTSYMFKKEGISTEEQIRVNDKIVSLLKEGKEDTVIIYHLVDNHAFTLSEARQELAKAKMWIGWYSHTSNKEKFINSQSI